ncbi:MAG: hypothetical protein ACD_50C00389G0011 [uncultured bacterium]|nr:MAG: hypothetical protein ACD_50C00389G0011 [uncultured bacterium]
MERMEERVVETDHLQYFLSDSNWDWRLVNHQIVRDSNKLLVGMMTVLCRLTKQDSPIKARSQ